MATIIKNLTPIMRRAIEIEIADPRKPAVAIAQELGISETTMYNWQHSPCYQEELDRRLREETRMYAKRAIANMIKLSEEGNFNATKYLSDFADFGAKEKVEIGTTNDIKIRISND